MDHKFSYEWYLKDGYPATNIQKNELKVFGTFICGGGSSMGYKLAGYNHLGGVEIDPQVAKIYKKNHNPKYLYNMDIRDFNKLENLPEELFNLDILDGSPPCSTFSMAGSREKAWGKKKRFREGQQIQTLDDLVFVYCDTIIKLKPKVFILENVKGLTQGNAKIYVKKIIEKMGKAGYNIQLFLLNSATMGVPQKRERVFIIGHKKELNYKKLVLNFKEKPILYGQILGPIGEKISDKHFNIWSNRKIGQLSFSDTLESMGKNKSNWNTKYIYKNSICNTITTTAKDLFIEFERPYYISQEKIIKIGSFPLDYNFMDIDPTYLIGMSVPPVMMANIANEIYLQWFKKGGF